MDGRDEHRVADEVDARSPASSPGSRPRSRRWRTARPARCGAASRTQGPSEQAAMRTDSATVHVGHQRDWGPNLASRSVQACMDASSSIRDIRRYGGGKGFSESRHSKEELPSMMLTASHLAWRPRAIAAPSGDGRRHRRRPSCCRPPRRGVASSSPSAAPSVVMLADVAASRPDPSGRGHRPVRRTPPAVEQRPRAGPQLRRHRHPRPARHQRLRRPHERRRRRRGCCRTRRSTTSRSTQAVKTSSAGDTSTSFLESVGLDRRWKGRSSGAHRQGRHRRRHRHRHRRRPAGLPHVAARRAAPRRRLRRHQPGRHDRGRQVRPRHARRGPDRRQRRQPRPTATRCAASTSAPLRTRTSSRSRSPTTRATRR